jgi:hypothetical protein
LLKPAGAGVPMVRAVPPFDGQTAAPTTTKLLAGTDRDEVARLVPQLLVQLPVTATGGVRAFATSNAETMAVLGVPDSFTVKVSVPLEVTEA